MKEQSRNKRSNRLLEYNGEVKSMVEWAELFNIPYTRMYSRIHDGWTTKDAIEKPVNEKYVRRKDDNTSRM